LPIGIAVDSNGNIYVSDAGLSRILKFAPVK
jgi:sugar lactone lactonase YvrE